jgi:S-DNA-T family DNA segregation ATPase FtsK/SpoIIIE
MSAEKRNKFRSKNNDEIDVEEIEKNSIEDYVTPKLVEKQPVERKKNKPKSTPKVVEEETIVEDVKPPKEVKNKTKEKDKSKITLAERLEKFKLFYNNERTQKIFGLLLVLFSAYLAIAFVSYFFTWQIDQDKVLGSSEEFFLPETKVKNWLGKAGALISHLFMYKGFGAASFILVPVFFLYGIQKVVQKKFINIGSFNAKWLFLLVWSSLVLSYFFSETLFYMGGGFGYFINAQLSNYVGGIGLIALLAFSMLTFLVLIINLSFKLPAKPVIEEDEQIQAEIKTQPVPDKEFNSSFNELKDSSLTPEEEAELLNFEVLPKKEEEKALTNDATFEILKPIEEIKTEPEPIDENKIEMTNTLDTVEVVEKNGEPEFEIGRIVEEPIIQEDENRAAKLVEEFGEYDPTLDLGSYKFPSFELLNDYGNTGSKVNQEELIANKNRILSTLKNYGIEIDKITATVGPTVTLYEIVPAAGVRISKIKNLEDDIALSLAALGIRIIAPIPGKGTIGIEVPNLNPEMVPMKNILASEKFNNSAFELPIALGKTISNEIFIADLAKMPHLLMAGATGQGKSVGLNAVLVSLLYKKHPAQVKFVLVDPKKVELTLFNKIERHFLAKLPNSEDAIITDNTKVIHTLNSLCIEMDNRYALLQDAQVRNIKEYNTKFVNRKLNPNDGHKFLPYIVLVVDEFADLIMTAGKEVETPIARLAQLARALNYCNTKTFGKYYYRYY